MEFTPVFIVGFIVLGIYKMVELFVRKRERLTIIERLTDIEKLSVSGMDPIHLPNVSFENRRINFGSLRIALLLIGVGLGCTVAYIVQFVIFDSFSLFEDRVHVKWEVQKMVGMVYFASVCFFGGIGLLVAYLIERAERKKGCE
jgi:hypothetical protein